MDKILDKEKKIRHYSNKIDRLQREIRNKQEEIKISLLKLAELYESNVYQIPSNYNEVIYVDYVIAKNENEAREKGISESYYDEITEIIGSGIIYEDEIKEYK